LSHLVNDLLHSLICQLLELTAYVTSIKNINQFFNYLGADDKFNIKSECQIKTCTSRRLLSQRSL